MSDPIIGRGERTAEKILRFCYPKALIVTQVPIRLIREKMFSSYEMTEEQLRSSVDIILFKRVAWKGKMVAVRVQHGINQKGKIRGHTGDLKSGRDRIQKDFLVKCGFEVVDLWEYECPQLFKEKLNIVSVFEVSNAFWRAKVRP